MKKFLFVLAVLVMNTTANAVKPDTLTTFANMESTYVYSGVRYVWSWKQTAFGFPHLARADSIRYVSPGHSLRLQGNDSRLASTWNVLQIPPSVRGPGTFQIFLGVNVKRTNLLGGSQGLWADAFIKGWTGSGGSTTWVMSDSVVLNDDTLWHALFDSMTIQLDTVNDSLYWAPDTFSTLQFSCNVSGSFHDTLCVDDAYLTGKYTPTSGVEIGPLVKPRSVIHVVGGLRPGIYDIQGRRVDQMDHSGIYFVVRKDGSTTKVVHLR